MGSENTEDTAGTAAMRTLRTGTLDKPSSHLSVGMLERALLADFPREHAESWDKTGLVVGDGSVAVEGVAVALDATVEAIDIAKRCNANVLVTHHPPFLDAPQCVKPATAGGVGPQAVVWEAVSKGIALMCYHTALDVSTEASQVLPGMLHLDFQGILQPIDVAGEYGYGQVCRVAAQDGPMSLRNLAARCVSVFGRSPRVWGNDETRISSVVTCTGSAGSVVDACIEHSIDCLICGEVKYHAALDAASAGLCIIELGHDVSELPLCAVLAASVEAAGIDEGAVKIIDQSQNWNNPEATRK